MINLGDLLTVLRLKDEMTPEIRSAIASLKELNTATDVVKRRISDVEGVTQSAAYKFTLLGRGMKEVGMITTSLFTAPILAAGKATLDFGSGFEREMTKVITLAGSSAQFIDQLKSKTLALSAETGIAANDLAKGLFVIESYGFEASKTFDILTTAAKMAALGMGTTEQTALGLTGALFAFREQGMEAEKAANIFIKAVRLGNMEISEMIPAMATVNPLAASLGVSMEDTAASLATFTHAGVNARVASTGLRAMLSNILQNSVETEKGFRKLAAAVGDNSISMESFRKQMNEEGLTSAMVSLAEAVEKTGEAGMEAFDNIFPNIRALTNALAVYRLNGEQVLDIKQKLAASDNTLADTTRELKKTWDQQWKEMLREVENLWIGIAEGLLPILKSLLATFRSDFLPLLQDVVLWFKSLPEEGQKTLVFLGLFFAAIGPGTVMLGFFVEALGNVARGLGLLMAGNAAAGPKALVAFLANPWVLGGAAVLIALGAAYAYLTSETVINTDATIKAAGVHSERLEALDALDQKVKDTNISSAEYNYLVRELLSISPSAASAIAGQAESYDTLKNAIKGAKDEQKQLAENFGKILEHQINQLAEQRFAAQKSMSTYADLLNNPNVNMNDKASIAESYAKARQQVDDLTVRIDQARQSELSLREVYDETWAQFVEHTDIMRKFGEQVDANQMERNKQIIAGKRDLIKIVQQLTEEEKNNIRIGVEHKLTAAQIAEKYNYAADVVGIYMRQLNAAGAATNRVANEQERLTELTATNLQATQRLWEEYNGSIARLEGDSLAAKEARIEQWFIKEMGAIRRMEQEGVDTAERTIALYMARDARMAELGQDRINLEKRIASDMEQTWAEYNQAVAQGEQESLDSKLAAIDKWYSEQHEIIQTAAQQNAEEWKRLGLVVETYWAKRTAAIKTHAKNEKAAMDEIYSKIQKVTDDTEALWEEHQSIMSDVAGNSREAEIQAIQAQSAKAQAINQASLNKIIADIRESKNISTELEKQATDKAIEEARRKAEAIIAIEKAKIAQLKKEQRKEDFEAIAEGIDVVGAAIGGLTGEVVSGVSDMISAFSQWENGALSAAQKVGVALTGVANVMQATSGKDGGQWLSGGMAGAKAGMAIAGPYGALVGFGAGAIVGLVKGANDGRKAIEDFAKSFGGFDEMHDTLSRFGDAGEKMWIKLTQGTGRGDGKGAKKAIEEVKKEIEALTASINKYGLSWIDLTDPAAQLRGSREAAQELLKTMNQLISAGYSLSSVQKAMSGDVNAWLSATLQAGLQIPPAMQPVIEQLIRTGQLTEENARLMLGYGATAVPTLDEIKEAAGRYGMKLEDLGEAVQQLSLTERANQIVKDFELMILAGVPFELLMQDIVTETVGANGEIEQSVGGMRVAIQALVDEALRTGRSIPESMRGILERMLEAGQLTDEFGEQLENLDGINFEVPLTAKIDELIIKLGELIDKIGDVGTAVGDIEVPDLTPARRGPQPDGPYPQADGGDYLVTKPTLFLAGEAGAERATFTPLGKGQGGREAFSVQINVYPTPGMSEEDIAERAARRVPQILREHGY
jgi:TP901 family phage tail tape measure protein